MRSNSEYSSASSPWWPALIDTYSIELAGQIIPKARPRVTSRGTYMPANYTSWKLAAMKDMRVQCRPVSGTVAIDIQLIGKHSRRGDADNISGAILDALVQAGIIEGDNLMIVRSLSIELNWDKKEPPITTIKITR